MKPRPSRLETTRVLVPDGLCMVFLAFLGALAYSPCLTNRYAHTDDYSLLWNNLTRGGNAEFLASMGRGVGGLLFSVAWWPVTTIDQLWIPRAFSILGILGLSILVFWSLRRLGYDLYLSLMVATLLLLLPTYTLYAAWPTACHYVYGALAAAAAFWAVELAWKQSIGVRLWTRLLGGVFLLVLAVNTYQPTAMFYFTMLIFLVMSPGLKDQPRERLKHWGLHLMVIVLGLGASYVIVRVTSPWFHGLSSRVALDGNLLGKFSWFLEEPLKQSCFLGLLAHEVPISSAGQDALLVLVAVLMVWGLFGFLSGGIRERAWRVAAALLLVPLTYLPNLIAAERWASYRTRGALTVAVAFLIVTGLAGLLGRLRISEVAARWAQSVVWALVVLVGVTISQYHIMHYLVVPFQVEWRTVRCELAQLLASQMPPREIVFLMPDQRLPIPRMWVYDEFGHLSSSRAWVPEAMCGLILHEIAPQRMDILTNAKFTLIPPSAARPPDREGRWLINGRIMNYLSDRVY